MDSSLRQRLKPLQTSSAGLESLSFDIADNRKKSQSHFTEKAWLVIFLFYLGISIVVIYCDVIRFPTPVSVDSLKQTDHSRSLKFSEERARNFVTELSAIGIKPTGSYENEVLAVDYLTRQLNHIKGHLKSSNTIEIEMQKTTGCFPLHFKDGMTTCYENVKNIIAKISPITPTNRSLLVNCHFDSVPTSPGASDDVVSCALMLEVLLSLSQHDQPLPHSVIFLFNGAEENILQASHGFITQHRWAKEIMGFINLEACGAGGKQMLFQADKERTWILQAYADGAPFPHGSVVAQDIFQSGLIPSDTDYRIFEKFGGLPGLDFAYVKNGYVYHTKYDVPQFITPGAIQQAGDNLLNLVHEALLSPGMQESLNQTRLNLVFFDFLGIFMVVYRVSFATTLNSIIITLACVDMLLKAKNADTTVGVRTFQVGKALLLMLGSFIWALAVNALIAVLFGYLGHTMSWYRTPPLIAGLYGCSSLSVILGIHMFAKNLKNKTPRDDWLNEDIYYDAARLLWVILLIVMQMANLNSSFICSAWILFPTIIRSTIGHIFGYTGLNGSSKSHLLIHMSMQIIPLLLLFYCVWSIYTVFVPILGRIGAIINPDIPIALFTAFFAFFSSAYMFSLVQVTTSVRKVLGTLILCAATTIILVCFTSVGFPYSGDPNAPAPQRCYILHTERTFRNKSGSAVTADSGYWVIPLDFNGPNMLTPYIQGLKDAQQINCDEELSCGMPFYMPVVSLLRKSYYVPASMPKIHSHRKFELVSRDIVGQNLFRLSFRATGPDHMTVVLSPEFGVDLFEWSLTSGTPLQGFMSNTKRQTYFIYYSYAEYTKPWEFSILLKAPRNYTNNSLLIDVAFITHHLHGHDSITGDFPALLRNLPPWVHASPWTCTFDMYSFK